MATTFSLPAYLARIGVDLEACGSDLATLQRLHTAHVGTIPFENVDVQSGRGVRLDLVSLQDKLVARRRGGYCFEQNTLFMHALRALGFSVIPCEARVRPPDASAILPRTHMVLVVTLEGRNWLADVGFGGEGLLGPLPLDGQSDFQIDRRLRVSTEGALCALQWTRDGAWHDYYAFAPEERFPVDFELGNWWVSTHPSSVFRSRLTVQRTLPDARHILRQLTYTIHGPHGAEAREIPRADVTHLLREVFGLDIDDTELPALDGAVQSESKVMT